MLEAARVMAERLMLEQSSPEEKIEKAFLTIMCREGKSEELKLLTEYFETEELNFKKTPEKAKQFIAVGEYPHEKIENTISLAALMQVIQTIFNTDEAITKA